LIQQFERDPLILFDCPSIPGLHLCKHAEILAGDPFEVRDRQADHAAAAEDAKTLRDQPSGLLSREMFEHMRGIASIDLVVSKGKTLAHVPRLHLGAGRAHVEIGPCRMPGCPAADVDQTRLHGRLLEDLHRNSAGVINGVKKKLESMGFHIFIHGATGTLPMAIIIDNQYPSSA
jgi:hypothetical protein